MDWITNFISGQGWGLAALILPVVLPNSTVYYFGYDIVGRLIGWFTIKTQDKPLAKMAGYIMNTVAAFCEGVVDKIRELPRHYDGTASNGKSSIAQVKANLKK